jgi:hypothetical protein
MAKRPRSTDQPVVNRDRFIGCDKPGDQERAEALFDQLVREIARQIAREDHLAEKQKSETEKG